MIPEKAAVCEIQSVLYCNLGEGINVWVVCCKVVESDVLGNLDLNQLELSTRVRSSALIDRGGFSMLQQTNQSHWLLLLALPLCLYLFIRERG